MVSMVKSRTEDDVLAMLIYGQKYQIKTLISTCINEARRLTLKELKEHRMRDQIEPDNYLEIAEGIIRRLEDRCKEVKNKSVAKLCDVSRSLYGHCYNKGTMDSYMYRGPTPKTTESYLSCLYGDVSKRNTHCDGLSSTAKSLQELKAAIETL